MIVPAEMRPPSFQKKGKIDRTELQLESRVGGLVESLRAHLAPALALQQSGGGKAPGADLPNVAQELLQKQALADLVVGVAGASRARAGRMRGCHSLHSRTRRLSPLAK